jgi:endonuclease YncB( thermonuclease family)
VRNAPQQVMRLLDRMLENGPHFHPVSARRSCRRALTSLAIDAFMSVREHAPHGSCRSGGDMVLNPALLLILVAGAADCWAAPPTVRGDMAVKVPGAHGLRAASDLPVLANVVTDCYALDGDTLRCGGERIRLVGIDTPEMPGHCQPGRRCGTGNPHAAKTALGNAVGPSMQIRRFGTDRYGRTLALVCGPRGDLSCAQLRGGHAIYRADWDVDGAMMRACS